MRIRARSKRLRSARMLALSLLVTLPATPQILPNALPGLPKVELPAGIENTVRGVTSELDPQELAGLRQLKLRTLLREHRRELEADPTGAPIVRSEVLGFAPTAAAIAALQTAGFVIARERTLEGLDARLIVFRAPFGLRTRSALKKIRRLDPLGTYDYNHLYTESGAAESPMALAEQGGAASVAQPGKRIGLIDGGLYLPAVRSASVHTHGCAGGNVPSTHGTGVASLLVGADGIRGSLPGAELYAADVYCGAPTGGAIDSVADALAWLARERVPVINISLVGPANVTLESVVRLLVARGHLIVAAVGNDGPAAPPLYPAAYPDVVGVTAVDSHERVLPEALRGKQVDFAAPGSEMLASNGSGKTAVVRGTSFAAPIVAGLLAAYLREPDPTKAMQAVAALAVSATDLGAKGEDKTYGKGLVGESLADRPAGITSNGRKR